MLNDSASVREETPHADNSNQNNAFQVNRCLAVAYSERAESLISDRSIDARVRAVIRYAFETSDPCLPELIRRADAGEPIIIETIASSIFAA